MKESQWRTKLIAMRRKTNPNDFIWAMDAKFKAGFPDLYLLSNGVPYHLELKINRFLEPNYGLAPLQEQILRQLVRAGAACFCLNLQEDNQVGVTEIQRISNYSRLFHPRTFEIAWSSKVPFSFQTYS